MKEHQKHLTSHIRTRWDFVQCHCVTKLFISTWGRKWNIITFVQAQKTREKQELFHSDQDNISFPFQDEKHGKEMLRNYNGN